MGNNSGGICLLPQRSLFSGTPRSQTGLFDRFCHRFGKTRVVGAAHCRFGRFQRMPWPHGYPQSRTNVGHSGLQRRGVGLDGPMGRRRLGGRFSRAASASRTRVHLVVCIRRCARAKCRLAHRLRLASSRFGPKVAGLQAPSAGAPLRSLPRTGGVVRPMIYPQRLFIFEP